MKRCSQTKCGFYLQGGCRNCDNCKANPYFINEDCVRCYKCENEEGELRWGEQLEKADVKKIIIIEN